MSVSPSIPASLSSIIACALTPLASAGIAGRRGDPTRRRVGTNLGNSLKMGYSQHELAGLVWFFMLLRACSERETGEGQIRAVPGSDANVLMADLMKALV